MPTIDLRRVIAGKNRALLKIIPRPIVRYLERVIHVDELNRGLALLDGREGLSFLGVSVDVAGLENLDDAERPMVVANHPLGGLDGVALMHVVGSNSDNVRLVENAFGSDTALVHFPAGLCSRKKGGLIRDMQWQKSFVVRSRRYQRDVVPVHADGRNSQFFYNLARLRRWFGLRFNVEMLYLADEMFKQSGNTIRLTFGRPIRWSTLHDRRSSWEWARRLRAHVYRVGRNPLVKFVP